MPLVRKLKDGVRWVEVVEREAPTLDRMLAAWVADIESVPFPANTSAPEATR